MVFFVIHRYNALMVLLSRPWFYPVVICLIFFGVVIGTAVLFSQNNRQFISPVGKTLPTPTPLPLLKYSFSNLRQTPARASLIELDSILDQKPNYTSWLFSFTTEGKKMTGQLNVPALATPSAGFPVILMLRGYVNPADYFTGVGTKNAAAVFAQNGYATLAPDFLGYGQSDPPAADTIAARLEKPKHILDLLASLKSLPVIDPARVGLWAHSNGGQIALSVLEITGQAIPTTLWAPVSKSFPYAILYYTDESDDQGKELRRVLAEFEKDYDTFDFSIDRYWDWIQAPVQVHQGTADDAVPLEWSAGLVNILKKTDPEVTLYTYPGADHNLRPDWDTAVARDLQFFDQSLLH